MVQFTTLGNVWATPWPWSVEHEMPVREITYFRSQLKPSLTCLEKPTSSSPSGQDSYLVCSCSFYSHFFVSGCCCQLPDNPFHPFSFPPKQQLSWKHTTVYPASPSCLKLWGYSLYIWKLFLLCELGITSPILHHRISSYYYSFNIMPKALPSIRFL